MNNDASKVSCLDSFLITRKCVTAGSDGNVLIWDIQVDDEMNLSSSANASTNISSIARSLYSAGAHAFGVSIKDKMNVSGVSFTSLATNPMSSSLVALGSSKGFLRIYNLRISDELVFSDEDYQQLYKDESETAEESGKESGEAAKKEISDDDSEKLKRVKKMLSQDHQPQLLFRERMHSSPIQKVLIQSVVFVFVYAENLVHTGFV